MKKLFLIMLIFTLKVMAAAETAPHLETYFDDDFTAGLRVSIPISDFRLTLRPDKQNFGAAVYTSMFFPRLPLTFKAGNLSAGGAVSTLNSPELTAGSSPFTTSISATSPLTATLPGWSSFSKPVSAFFEAYIPQHTLPFSFRLNTLHTNLSTSSITSAMLKLPLKKHGLTLSASYTGGLFTYESNSNSSWFLKSPWYSGGQHYCALFQLEGTYIKKQTNLSINICGALYESPFGFYQLVYRADSKLTTKHANFFAQIFYNPYDNLLTSSGKTLEPGFQYKSGVLYKSPSKLASLYFKKPVFFRAGINNYIRINLTKTDHPVKVNAGLQLSTEKNTQSLSVSAEGNLIAKSSTAFPHTFTTSAFSTQLRSIWKFENFSPSLSATLTLPQNPTSTKKYKITAGTTYQSKSQKLPLTLTATTSLTAPLPTNEEAPSPKFSASLGIRLKIKYLTIIGKLAFNDDLFL